MRAGVEVWAWVLMPNHVHLILMPHEADGIRRCLSAVHRRYAGSIHAAVRVRGVECTVTVTLQICTGSLIARNNC
jgi:REP element-mobilizing transposase RayT